MVCICCEGRKEESKNGTLWSPLFFHTQGSIQRLICTQSFFLVSNRFECVWWLWRRKPSSFQFKIQPTPILKKFQMMLPLTEGWIDYWSGWKISRIAVDFHQGSKLLCLSLLPCGVIPFLHHQFSIHLMSSALIKKRTLFPDMIWLKVGTSLPGQPTLFCANYRTPLIFTQSKYPDTFNRSLRWLQCLDCGRNFFFFY